MKTVKSYLVVKKQRISIARALYRNPDVLILDEPTSALDKVMEDKIINNLLIFKKEITIILVTHKENILNGFDKIYKFENRKLIEKNKVIVAIVPARKNSKGIKNKNIIKLKKNF